MPFTSAASAADVESRNTLRSNLQQAETIAQAFQPALAKENISYTPPKFEDTLNAYYGQTKQGFFLVQESFGYRLDTPCGKYCIATTSHTDGVLTYSAAKKAGLSLQGCYDTPHDFDPNTEAVTARWKVLAIVPCCLWKISLPTPQYKRRNEYLSYDIIQKAQLAKYIFI